MLDDILSIIPAGYTPGAHDQSGIEITCPRGHTGYYFFSRLHTWRDCSSCTGGTRASRKIVSEIEAITAPLNRYTEPEHLAPPIPHGNPAYWSSDRKFALDFSRSEVATVAGILVIGAKKKTSVGILEILYAHGHYRARLSDFLSRDVSASLAAENISGVRRLPYTRELWAEYRRMRAFVGHPGGRILPGRDLCFEHLWTGPS